MCLAGRDVHGWRRQELRCKLAASVVLSRTGLRAALFQTIVSAARVTSASPTKLRKGSSCSGLRLTGTAGWTLPGGLMP